LSLKSHAQPSGLSTNRDQATTQKAKKPWSIGIHFLSEAEKSQLVACAGFSHTA